MKTDQLSYQIQNHPSALTSDHSPIIFNLFQRSAQISPPKLSYVTDWKKYEDIITPLFSLPQSPLGLKTSIIPLQISQNSYLLHSKTAPLSLIHKIAYAIFQNLYFGNFPGHADSDLSGNALEIHQ